MRNTSNADTLGSYVFSQSRVYGELESDQHDPNGLMYTMRHLHRAQFTGQAPKSLHLTKNIKVIWNHAPVRCISDSSDDQKCSLHWVSRKIGYLLHFRTGMDRPANCTDDEPKKCAVLDTVLLKFKNQLETNMKIALEQIF